MVICISDLNLDRINILFRWIKHRNLDCVTPHSPLVFCFCFQIKAGIDHSQPIFYRKYTVKQARLGRQSGICWLRFINWVLFSFVKWIWDNGRTFCRVMVHSAVGHTPGAGLRRRSSSTISLPDSSQNTFRFLFVRKGEQNNTTLAWNFFSRDCMLCDETEKLKGGYHSIY